MAPALFARAARWGWPLLAASLLAACQDKEAAPKLQKYTGPLLETENVHTILSDSARPHIRLNSSLEQRFENGDLLYPKGATLTSYDKPGKAIASTIEAKWIKYDSNRQLYIARGDVRVANVPAQQKLNTEELFYDRAKQKIYTDNKMFVRVETPTEVLTGYGLDASQDFSRYSIHHPVGTFTVEQARSQGK